MNPFKRAWWRLIAHPGKTALMVLILTVICTLVLSGLLVQSAVSRATEDAKRQVGAVATMKWDLNAAINSGAVDVGPKGGQFGLETGNLDRRKLDQMARMPGVQSYNYLVDNTGANPTSGIPLYRAVPPPADSSGANSVMTDFFSVNGVLDSSQLSAFRSGDSSIVSGHGLSEKSSGNQILVEQRLANADHLKVGDKVKLKVNALDSGDLGKEIEFTIVGVYRSGTASSSSYVPPMSDPGNLIYTTLDGAAALNSQKVGAGGAPVKQATFNLTGPDQLAALNAAAKKAGFDPKLFPITLNDTQYQAMVGPIDKTADFATLTVWLVSVAGLGIVALLVAAQVRDRRRELGILMAMGERKPRLLGQQLAEVVACALLAVGLSTAVSPFLSQALGSSLLSDQVSSAQQNARQQEKNNPGQLAGAGGSPVDGTGIKPISKLEVSLGAGDIAGVGAAGLGIAALAVVAPGLSLMRLQPNEILTKGE
ncbi:FtsX-like permease family protein [Kitasatospora sp. HPMI-4]|uniref:FtsX-like permease family protein n=1 Tax=Kitasatospora sp. HPMI-4 TaxID=3448443 RepID=UPI003F1DF377